MIRGCLMFIFTLFFVSLFSLVAGYFAYTQLGRSPTVSMPSLLMLPQEEAIISINKSGLKLAAIETREDPEHRPGTVIGQHPSPLTPVKRGRGVTLYVAKLGTLTTIPELRGVDERNVALRLGREDLGQGLIARAYHPTLDAGKVIGTYPPAGAEVPAESGVDLLISRGPRPVAYVMPDLFRQRETEAREVFEKLGIPVEIERRAVRSESLVGIVIDQSPQPGGKVSTRVPVKLLIGKLEE